VPRLFPHPPQFLLLAPLRHRESAIQAPKREIRTSVKRDSASRKLLERCGLEKPMEVAAGKAMPQREARRQLGENSLECSNTKPAAWVLLDRQLRNQRDSRLRHLVDGGYRLGVGLITALFDNQARELRGDVHVGLFQ